MYLRAVQRNRVNSFFFLKNFEVALKVSKKLF